MKNIITDALRKVKKASYALEQLSEENRTLILRSLAANLRLAEVEIIRENQKDLALLSESDPKYDRLLLTEARIQAMADDIESVAALCHPNNVLIEENERPNGLRIQKRRVPLGVVAVIYESRPNVTIDVFTLCFKTGNACILKGGKEAFHSNQVLVSLILKTLRNHQQTSDVVYLMPPEREAMNTLLTATGLVDVCIPRGSSALINYVRDHAKIPVIETGAGIVHVYFDASGDVQKGRLIINNAKTRRVSVCNALDTLVIHQSRVNDLPALVDLLAASHVIIFADSLSYEALVSFYPKTLLRQATVADYGQEFLDYKMSIKTVASLDDAINHIRHYSSGHSEAIIAKDSVAITTFLNQIDAAVVYVNASTAFTDGGQFGMGAEIGISTQKLHARGPMALDALTSYKWIVLGDGQIRS